MDKLSLQEMKPGVWLQTDDGSIQQVEEDVAKCCPVILQEIVQNHMGSSNINPIILPDGVNSATLGLIMDYCRFYMVPGHSNKERKAFDYEYTRLATDTLCDLASAAENLQLRSLAVLTRRALARVIQGKSEEEIRAIFKIPGSLTEEEKLEPLQNPTHDPHIRRLNILFARKREELGEREQTKNVEVEEEPVDERSVDDLLAFINGEEKESKGEKAGKSKRKNRKKKKHTEASSSSNKNGDHKEPNDLSESCQNATTSTVDGLVSTSDPISELQDDDDDDIIDDSNPRMHEINREVAIFERRLDTPWEERKQEFYRHGQ